MSESTLPRDRLVFIVSVGLAVVALAGLSRWYGSAEKVPWQTDLAAARREAAVSGKRVLIDFTAAWCGPCEQMKRSTWSDAGVADAIAAGYVPVRIDVDQQPAVAKAYDVNAIPRLVVEEAAGQVRRSTEGAMDAAAFRHWLGRAGPTPVSPSGPAR